MYSELFAKYCKISNSTFHSLTLSNEWLVRNEDVLVTCDQETILEMAKLNGTDIISVNKDRKIYKTTVHDHLNHTLNFKLLHYADKNVNTYFNTLHYINKLNDLYIFRISTSDVIRNQIN